MNSEQEKLTKEQEAFMKGTMKLLDKCRNTKQPYIHPVNGRDFIVLPNVFSPRYFRGTEFYAKEVPKFYGDSFLEIGTGTGAVACSWALDNGGECIATDINPDAVRNAQINVLLHHLEDRVKVMPSDVYAGLPKGKGFSTIFWNTPFANWSTGGDVLNRAVCDAGYHCLEEFVSDAPEHLRHRGQLLIGFSTEIGDYKLLESLLKEYGFQKPELAAESGRVRQGSCEEKINFKLFAASLKEGGMR